MKIWKRGISLFLIAALLISVCPVKVQAADEEAQEGRVSVRTMKFSEKGGYEQDGTEERINVLVQNETLLVDVDWLCDKLHFIYDVRDGEQGFLWQAENADSVHVNGADMNIKDIPEMGKMLAGYAKAFRDFSGGKELRIRKTYDSPIIFFLRTGSEQAYAYSRYMGDLNADLGANVVEKDGTIYVPFTMFLNLIDSYYCMDGDTVVLYPCQNTVVDILHSSNGLNERYSFDIAEDGGLGQFNYNLASGYDNFYRKVKSLFQGTVGFDWETVKQAWPSDTSRESDELAVELCTNSQDDLNELSTFLACGADGLTMNSTFDAILKDIKKDDVKGNLRSKVKKWTEAKKTLAKPTGSISLNEYVNAYCDVGKEMGKSRSIMTKAEALENTGMVASIVFSGFAEYCMLTHEISSSQKIYVDSVQKYIQYYRNLKNTAMSSKMIDQIEDKTKLYSNKDTNPFQNDELLDAILQKVKNGAISTVAGESAGKLFSKFASDVFMELQLVSVAWDMLELHADKESGGKWTALDALHYGTYMMLLEYDSNQIVDDYIQHENDLDTYRQLEWIRLRSYYLARQDIVTFYQPVKKSEPERYNKMMLGILRDCKELQKMMAVLSVGLTGVTQDALDKCEKANVENNATLIESVSIINNRELLEKLTDGYWWNKIQDIGAYKFKEDGTWGTVPCTYPENYVSGEPLVITGKAFTRVGTYEIKGNELFLYYDDFDSPICRLLYGTREKIANNLSTDDAKDEWKIQDYPRQYMKEAGIDKELLYETNFKIGDEEGSDNAYWLLPYEGNTVTSEENTVTSDDSNTSNNNSSTYQERINQLWDEYNQCANVTESQMAINRAYGTNATNWDNLMNDIYGTIREKISSSEFETLKTSQKEWLAKRESDAKESASDWEGGSGYNMAYYAALAKSTGQRCEWLVDQYLK